VHSATKKLVGACIASKVLGVHPKTLIRWAHSGIIAASRLNPRGKWLFDISSVGKALITENKEPEGDGGVNVIYARVSTRKQLDDLESQIGILKTKYPDHVIISDCASGLNFKRKGLLSLLQLAFARRLQVVRVAHGDRL